METEKKLLCVLSDKILPCFILKVPCALLYSANNV